ncbi:hypothetical protein [Vibrio hippocampi]|uniref:DUF3757 domain-containing protein n=1 Tax=Vibrio hippocampi TaxID=654686 RepID=A0ABN8DJM5_9VIBR|nr:hypothetical protein [Vibrio hippocampi]CAH0529559.1 hypothetical protein VHP8226_03314 [Vibrio hippocampi]
MKKILLVTLLLSSSISTAAIIDYLFEPKVGLYCDEINGDDGWYYIRQHIAPLVWENDLYEWLSDYKTNAGAEKMCNRRANVLYEEGVVSLQSACILLEEDPANWFVIFNNSIEFTRDHDSNAEPCSLEGLLL